MIRLTVGESERGRRLDRILRTRLPLRKLGDIYGMIRRGEVRVDGRKRAVRYRLREGQQLRIALDPAELDAGKGLKAREVGRLRNTAFFRENFRLIFEDEVLLVCDKPTGLVVHSGTGHTDGETLRDLVASYLSDKGARGGAIAPLPVHRLDRDTSGVILIAKTQPSLRALHDSFRRRAVTKDYRAVCHGRPQPGEGRIEVPLAKRFDRNRGAKVRVEKGGVYSHSAYRVLGSNMKCSLLHIRLHTGRTHQIRVHLAHNGWPVVGDARYGNESLDRELFSGGARRRLYLHALELQVPHPVTGTVMRFSAPLPSGFEKLPGRHSDSRRGRPIA